MRIYQPDRTLLDSFIASQASSFGGKLLDVGGGDGKRYRSHFSGVSEYVSLDPDPSFQPDIVAGAEEIPLADASVDGILCSEVLMYIFNVQRAIDEMARVLKPGAPIVITTSFMATPAVHDHYQWQPGYMGLKNLLTKDFESICIEPRGRYHCQMAQNKRRYAILKYDLYKRKYLGRAYALFSRFANALAFRADRADRSAGNAAFTMGYNVTAVRKK